MLAACVTLAALALATPASAQDEQFRVSSVTQDQYGDSAAQYGGGDSAAQYGGGDSADPASVGSLPFTGLDVGLLAVAAAGLVTAGFLLRRRAGAEG